MKYKVGDILKDRWSGNMIKIIAIQGKIIEIQHISGLKLNNYTTDKVLYKYYQTANNKDLAKLL